MNDDAQTLAETARLGIGPLHAASAKRKKDAHDAVDALEAAVAALQHERDEAVEAFNGTDYYPQYCDEAKRRKAAEARVRVLEAREASVRRWFRDEPWKEMPDGTDWGCGPYSPDERQLGYGTYRDPRFLPAALRVLDADTPEEAA